MDQEKIGKFIAECRKEAGYTQASLADQLGITNRSVSKWENGKSLPDASNMLELCKLLNISINELLTGEHISMENYKENAEKNFEILKTKIDTTVRLLNILSIICVVATVILAFTILLLNWYYQGPWDYSRIMTAEYTLAGVTVLNAIICTMLKYKLEK